MAHETDLAFWLAVAALLLAGLGGSAACLAVISGSAAWLFFGMGSALFGLGCFLFADWLAD